jgi:TonB family protein
MIQWFNPLVWIYIRFIRQNHEYLADEVALQRTSDPAIYKAVLLNQIVGAPVVSLTNSFNYSLNRKRFNMMKNIISSPYRKMKILLILPVFAIVLYAFAKPDYRYKYVDESSGNNDQVFSSQTKTVKGIVQKQNGESLSGAIIVIQGTTIGTITDAQGHFTIENVPDDGHLVISFVGFKSRVLKPVFNTELKINMERDTVKFLNENISTPPPPPPSTDLKILSENGETPLIVVDGTVKDIDLNKIDQGTIESITVLKDKSATEKYGEKGKNGVLEITTKKEAVEHPFVVVEEMPEFPGGKIAMVAWISANLKYPEKALKAGISGKVYVSFIISSTGKVKNAIINKSVSPSLNDEAIRVISSMPEWKPGSQGGKPVDVQMLVPVEFKF